MLEEIVGGTTADLEAFKALASRPLNQDNLSYNMNGAVATEVAAAPFSL